MRSRAAMFAGGAAVGLAAGWLLAQYRFVRHREDLFSTQPLRRLGALGFLAGQQGVETVRLLQDYLTWETQPVLRRRAETLVRRMEAALG
jgi:hypothetical protein